ncbi:MAG: extracellular solute-binding protein, partial [Anaerolineae bacterium]|nr:extracellular solute-binding protein [Anaerolineae bacterium]
FIQPQETNRCADEDGRWHGIGSCWVAMQTYHNIDLLAEEGITPPGFLDDELWDWDTLVENTKQLTVDSAGRHPGESGFDSDDIQRWGISMPVRWEMVGGLVHSNGGKFINDEGLIALDSPEALEALQMFQDLIYVHHVMPRTASLESLGMTNTQMLDNGRLAMAVDGSWALSWMNPSMVSINLGTGAIPYIGEPADMIQAHFHSAISTTEHPEEAWEWVRFLATPFYQTEFLKIGLWLPSQTALTTEEGLATWITEGIHTENYPDFVTSYIPNHGVALRIPAGYVEANSNFIQPAWDALAAGTPAADVFPDAVRQANEIISAAQM